MIIIAAIIVYYQPTPQQPCPHPPKQIPILPKDAILIYRGDVTTVISAENVGGMYRGDYGIIYPNVKTHLPFRPTAIEGKYKTIIVYPALAEGTTITDLDMSFHIVNYPETKLVLPLSWQSVNVVMHL